MKINIDEKKEILISEFRKKIIFDLVNKEEFLNTVFENIKSIMDQLYRSSILNLRNTWTDKLSERNIEIPTSDEEFANLVFSQSDYSDRLEREAEAEAERNAKFSVK